MISIDKFNIAPFLSILLGVNHGKEKPEEIHKVILDILQNEDRKKQQVDVFETSNHLAGESIIHYTPYKVIKTPSWYKGSGLNDIENHVLVSICLKKTYAFYFSEKGMKDEIRSYFFSTKLPHLKVVEINALNYLFINEDKVKMLWLLGIHGKNSFKADSKVLGGDSVADTLDPLEDQSFTMSAVRTELDDSEKTIGINPFKSSLWRGPCKDWDTFENRVIEILDKIERNVDVVENPISILATPISDMKDVKSLYDLAFIDYEFYREEDSKIKYELLKKIHEEYTFEVNSTISSHKISVKVYNSGKYIGEVNAESLIKDYSVEFNVSIFSQNGKKKELDYFARVFKYPELIKCWYESGHAIVNGKVFKTEYRDVIYDGFIWADFENFNICQEKPGLLGKQNKVVLEEIGKQKSLFCWIKNRWSGSWGNKDQCLTTEKPTGWLYCDDGAGEKSDFIHVVRYNNNTYISLIHVKASSTNSQARRLSVGAHDIVLNQAIKNLRYINRKELVSDLKERIASSEKKYCWKDNNEKDSSEFITFLEGINNQSDLKMRIIVIQPHTRKSYYNNGPNSNIRKQLDVLLVSAETAIRSSGAEFYIVGFDDS
jgi:hypothetical protein